MGAQLISWAREMLFGVVFINVYSLCVYEQWML